MVFYCRAVCRAGTGSGRVLLPLSTSHGAGVNAAVDDPWQPHNGCQHPLARESATRQVAGHPPPDARQGAGEVEQTVVLDLVAFAAPLGVIAVLLSAPRVAPGSLQMAAPVERDPDIAPRGRNGQALDPGGVAAVAEG